MITVGYARVSSTGQDLGVQLEKLEGAGCEKVFKEKRSGADAGRPELKRCLEYLREGDILLVTKIDRLARSTSDLYRIISQLSEKGVSFKVVDDPTIDTTSRGIVRANSFTLPKRQNRISRPLIFLHFCGPI
jgi:DNA invertase Pin-like site-specific DNA recombinase